MNSPITGKPMSLHREKRSMQFRKEEFEIIFQFYQCSDSNERFTTSAFDEIHILQLHNSYRAKHNLPFPQEIRDMRQRYGLPANQMSEILGFGVNIYRQYEKGEVPNFSNGKLIKLAQDPEEFKKLVKIADTLNVGNKDKLLNRLEKLINQKKENSFSRKFEKYLLESNSPNEYNGYKEPSLQKVTEMIIFFTERLHPWKTQLNKLLFYADFLSFKRSCFSISGLRYRAIQMGPVPAHYDSIYDNLARENAINIISTEFPNGKIGDQFVPHTDRKFNSAIFSDKEIDALEKVAEHFKNYSTKRLIDASHREVAWITNQEAHQIISYLSSFDLKEL